MKLKYGLQWLYTKWGIPYQLLQINSDPALTSEDYIGLSHYLLSNANLNTYTICGEKDIDDFKKYIVINAALNEMQQNNAINDERIVVYYQPYYFTSK